MIFLAYQTRFSTIFPSADKSYLTYPYPTRGIDKKLTITCVINTLVVYRRSCNSVIKTLGIDVTETSYTTSTFNMADINVQERDSLMATPTL